MVSSENIYLLGAGFTRAVYPKAPVNEDLLGAIIDNGGKKISEYQKKHNTDDIERLLTQIDLDSLRDERIKRDRALINEEISGFFSKLRFSVLNGNIPSWLKIFSKEVLKQNDSIISLNYDCLLEGVLDKLEVWTPNDGYTSRIRGFPTDSIPSNPNNIIIYKIHGSENFVESEIIENPHQTAIGFKIEESIYPRSGANSYLGGGISVPSPYIIAPSFVKIPHVQIAAMMIDLLDVVRKARRLAIIGCKMRPEDSFLWLLLTRFLEIPQENRKKLIILGPSSKEIWKRISNYWVVDINSFADVSVIPCGLESGIKSLVSAIA
ncbi:MAG: SIR2 family protein [Planctomycetota bacterium]|jgi:hypothetical protein